MNVVLLARDEVGPDGTARLVGARARHVVDVLRATSGQDIRVGIVDGPFGVGTVTTVGDATVDLRCTFDDAVPSRPPVDLLLALPRPKVMRRLWAQLAAFGVGRIILTNAERVERHYFDAHVLSPEIYTPLLIEGLQQARDTRLPLVTIARRLKPLIEDELEALCPVTVRIVLHPGADAPLDAVARAADVATRILLAIGPEGGWNEFELALLGAHGFVEARMGSRTLRTDTACVAALAIVSAAVRARRV
ncbi:MAG TPA: RsmE family RNA methyltransferase [Vicinamibacterales bacterium]|jgi:RsmE family RNA methyltransferase|nr:RsmE family RNA methyltransferase [Vicinamibacterales bacterium]